MSCLTIVQDACKEVGLPEPDAIVSSTDINVAQMLRLLNKEGKEQVMKRDWQVLRKETTFSATAAETQTGAVPTDFARFVDDTFYNRSRTRAVVGPLTPQEWQIQKSLTATVVVDAFIRRGNDILMIPNPTASDTMAFEYISKYWVDTDADGDGDAEAFADDDYTSILDEELLTQGVIWRYKAARGFEYAEDFRTYEATLARLYGDDKGTRVLDLARQRLRRKPLMPEVPEGSWDL